MVVEKYYLIQGFMARKKPCEKFTYCGNIRTYAIVIFDKYYKNIR